MEIGPKQGLYGRRYSKCMDASRRAQIERQKKLTPLERAALALELGHRMAYVRELARRGRARPDAGA